MWGIMWDDFFESGTIIGLEDDRYLIGWGKRTWIASPDNSDTPKFYCPDFFLTLEKTWFVHEFWKTVETIDFAEDLPMPPMKWSSPQREPFEKSFKELATLFQQGQLKKAVPYLFLNSQETMTRERIQKSLQTILAAAQEQKLHVYGFWGEGKGILGATPEILFQYRNQRLQTVACAGTQKYHQDFGPKEFEEHSLVIEGIKEVLEPFGQISLGSTEIKALSLFSHLFTPIELKLNTPFQFSQIVTAMHPTPALGAVPREKGWEWLQEYEKKINRGRFGAPIGCIYDNYAYCYVAIRNVQWTPTGTAIGAGCGVTLKSDAEDEWQEIQLKLQSIQRMLAL